MNYLDNYPLNSDRVIDHRINFRIKQGIDFLAQNNDTNIFSAYEYGVFVIVKKYKNNEQDIKYEIIVGEQCTTKVISEDELIEAGVLLRPLTKAKVGDIILASNDKKYKILEEMNGVDILIMDVDESKIVEGWNKEVFFKKILTDKLNLIDDSDIYPIKIIE